MLMQVGPQGTTQSLTVIDKHMDGSIVKRDAMSVMYVPLVKRS